MRECGKPGAKTITVADHVLLYRFGGVDVVSHRSQGVSNLTSQSQDIESAQDLEERNKRAESMASRFNRTASGELSTIQAATGSDRISPAICDNLLDFNLESAKGSDTFNWHAARELQKRADLEMENELRLRLAAEEEAERAEAIAEAEAAAKAEQKDKQEVAEPELVDPAIAFVEYRVVYQNQGAALDQKVGDHERKALVTIKDLQGFVEDAQCPEDLKESIEQRINDTKTRLAAVKTTIEDKKKEWVEFAVAGKTAQEYVDQQKLVKDYVANFKDVATFASLTASVISMNKHKLQVKKAFDRLEKSQAKADASKKCSRDESIEVPTVCLHLEKYFDDHPNYDRNKNVKWILKDDLLDKDGDAHVVQIPSERTGNLLTDVTGIPYYISQKDWVADVLKKNARQTSSAIIVKPLAAKKVRSLIEKYCPEARPNSKIGNDVVDEVLAPKFWQHVANGAVLENATSMNLVDFRMTLEGTEYVAGIPWASVTGSTLQVKFDEVCNWTAPHFLGWVETHGFSFQSKPGAVYGLPPQHFLLILGQKLAPSHGLRWSYLGDYSKKQQAEKYLKIMCDNDANLYQGSMGKFREYLQTEIAKFESAEAD